MIAIIQARTSSRRFKNKVMIEIKGKPMISHVIESIKKSKMIKKLVIATSNKKSDDLLAQYLKRNFINIYRGSLKNVAQRMYNTAKKFNANYFIRISGDSPFLDKKIIERAIKIHKKNIHKFDLITNVFPKTYPQGQSVEIIKRSLLKKTIPLMNADEKEHVTKYFYKHPKMFKIKNFKATKKSDKKLSIDTKKDLERLKYKFR